MARQDRQEVRRRRHPGHARAQALGLELLGDLLLEDDDEIEQVATIHNGLVVAIATAMAWHMDDANVQWRCCETLAYLMDMSRDFNDDWVDLPFQRDWPVSVTVFRAIIVANVTPALQLALERFPHHAELERLVPVLLAVLEAEQVCILACVE
jgi:hypothetical protein